MKKIIILISLFLMTSALAYSHYFAMGLYVPLGGSIPGFLPNKLYEPATIGEEKWSFEMGVIFQPGLYFELGKFHYIAVSLDFGWYRDTFKFHNNSQKFIHEFDSIMTGLNIEWRPSLFQLGIGGGVKFPCSGKYLEGDIGTKLSGDKLAERFNTPVIIPYLKLYAGVNFYFVNLSLYMNVDIPYVQIKDNISSLGYGYKYPGQLAAFDVGVQIGIHLPLLEFGESDRIIK